MNKLNLNTDDINKIAAAEFHRQTGMTLTEKPARIVAEWTEWAVELIENYNRVVEILGLDSECKCGDHTTDDKWGYDCRVASH